MEEQLQDAVSIKTYEPRRTTNSVFEYFSKLPPEIRCIIWGLTIPCRTINPYRAHEFSHRFGPPIIAQVCHESREVARRTGSFVARSEYPGRYWFDSRYDTIHMYSNEDVALIPRSVESIFCPWEIQLKINIDQLLFPKLKLFQFQLHSHYLPRDAWKAWADGRLQPLGKPDHIFLDIDNEHEVQRLADTLLSYSGGRSLSPYWADTINFLRKQEFRLHADHKYQDWKAAREQLQERWLRVYRENVASAESNNNEQAWRVKKPEFRRVLTVVPHDLGM
ncbi:hypothetical protein F5Y07DRAFT_267005 [Xylaria sp. FL0933]|nr:hypothetical protein F5Y07DRAFT_267005 [Xylaria sp. FL0933]